MPRYCLTIGLVFLATGCDSDQIARLEKQNQELQAQINKQQQVVDLDTQAKCAKDAKVFLNEGWRRDSNTVLLDYWNHYNKSLGKCFIRVEHHTTLGKSLSWDNMISLWDIYENVEYGHVTESHIDIGKPDYKDDTRVYGCEVLGKKCKSIQEFSGLTQSYMNN